MDDPRHLGIALRLVAPKACAVVPRGLAWRYADSSAVEGLQVLLLQRHEDEPPHVHVDHSGRTVKIWLDTLQVAYNDGYPVREVTAILKVVDQHREQLLRAWHGYFDD